MLKKQTAELRVLAGRIMRDAAEEISHVDGVLEVDAEPREDWSGGLVLFIEPLVGPTLRLTLDLADE